MWTGSSPSWETTTNADGRVEVSHAPLIWLVPDLVGFIGFGFRAMMAGGVVRFDYAVSEEGSAGWVMFGQPF